MSNFLEVIPGVCISTRRIVSVEAQEHKDAAIKAWNRRALEAQA